MRPMRRSLHQVLAAQTVRPSLRYFLGAVSLRRQMLMDDASLLIGSIGRMWIGVPLASPRDILARDALSVKSLS